MDNLIWENKGIILGLIRYILKYYDELIDKTIIINNDKIRHIIRKIFYDFTFKKKSRDNSQDNEFVISIKSTPENHGLIINNINNLTEINGKIILLPWYDKDNPIIMFEYNKNKSYDVEKIKNKINKFTQNERMNWSYDNDNNYNYFITNHYGCIKSNCNSGLWDTFIEFMTLRKYIKYYKEYNIDVVHNYITTKLSNNSCLKQTQVQQTYVQTYVPQKEIVTQIKYIPHYVPNYILVPYKENQDNSHIKSLLGNINEKIKLTNTLIDINQK